jgi:hypothetical protein
MPPLLLNCLPFSLFQISGVSEIAYSLYLLKLSWPKTLVKKWFNIRSKAEDFHADDVVYGGDNDLTFLSISA